MMYGENSTRCDEDRNNGNADDGDRATSGDRPTSGHRRKGGENHVRNDPSETRNSHNATSDSGALLHLIKSSLGSGILAMPYAFKNGGLIFGLIGTAAVGLLCAHCIYLLVQCSQTMARRTRRPALGFADTTAAAFSNGPQRFRSWTLFARKFVNATLFCTYYFGNCVYIILISASFKQVADAHTPTEWHFSIRAWILGLIIPILPLGIIRSLRVLVPFSAIATAFILIGLGCTMLWVVTGVSLFNGKEVVANPLPDIGSVPWIAPVSRMPLFFTTVIFAMEGIGTVLPIENSMRHPKHFLTARPCGVLNAAMALVIFLYATSGFLGYLRFGDTVEGSITLNLPNDLFAEAVKIMIALSILFSYGLQFCVPSEIVWARLGPWLHERRQNAECFKNDKSVSISALNTVTESTLTTTTVISTTSNPKIDEIKQLELELEQQEKPVDLAYYVMRSLMILVTFIIAAIVPNLAPIISLFGAIFFSMLGLFCPAVIHLITFWENSDQDDENYENTNFEENLGLDGDNYVVLSDFILESGVVLQQRRRNSGNSTSRKKGMNWFTAAKDVIIIFLALIAMVSGTYASLIDIIAFYGA